MVVAFRLNGKETPTIHPDGHCCRCEESGVVRCSGPRRPEHWGQMKAAPVAYDSLAGEQRFQFIANVMSSNQAWSCWGEWECYRNLLARVGMVTALGVSFLRWLSEPCKVSILNESLQRIR